MGGIGRVGKTVGVEAGAFVDDFHPNLLRREPTTETDVLGRIQCVAVANGIDQRLVDRQMNAEDVATRPVQGFKPTQQLA